MNTILALRDKCYSYNDIVKRTHLSYEVVIRVLKEHPPIIPVVVVPFVRVYPVEVTVKKVGKYDHLFEEPMNPGKKDYKAYVRDGR
jgi:hypothetical protein